MGGVKELFKDEKQIKNLNPAKMGKVKLDYSFFLLHYFCCNPGLSKHGQGYGPSHVESYRGDAGDREHDETDAARRGHARRNGNAGDGANAEEKREKVKLNAFILEYMKNIWFLFFVTQYQCFHKEGDATETFYMFQIWKVCTTKQMPCLSRPRDTL